MSPRAGGSREAWSRREQERPEQTSEVALEGELSTGEYASS